MGILQKISFDNISNKMSFLFRGASPVSIDPEAVLAPGTVLVHAGSTAPEGFLLCDGSAVSRNIYRDLFNAISTAHGYGDNSTTFNLPDCRGRFVRGVDGSASRDPDKVTRVAANTGGNTGNNVGSIQANATAKNGITSSSVNVTSGDMSINSLHTHTPTQGFSIISYSNVTTPHFLVIETSPYKNHAMYFQDNISNTSIAHTHNLTPNTQLANGALETRPVNIYVNYIIKT